MGAYLISVLPNHLELILQNRREECQADDYLFGGGRCKGACVLSHEPHQDLHDRAKVVRKQSGLVPENVVERDEDKVLCGLVSGILDLTIY